MASGAGPFPLVTIQSPHACHCKKQSVKGWAQLIEVKAHQLAEKVLRFERLYILGGLQLSMTIQVLCAQGPLNFCYDVSIRLPKKMLLNAPTSSSSNNNKERIPP